MNTEWWQPKEVSVGMGFAQNHYGTYRYVREDRLYLATKPNGEKKYFPRMSQASEWLAN